MVDLIYQSAAIKPLKSVVRLSFLNLNWTTYILSTIVYVYTAYTHLHGHLNVYAIGATHIILDVTPDFINLLQ